MQKPQMYLIVILLIFGFHLITGCSQKDNPAAPDRTSPFAGGESLQKLTVITVPSGDVDALYDAVYDQNGLPRDKVEINVEPGIYALDPDQPFDGRLVLGEKTILRSTLEMELDANGVPLVDNNEPVVTEAGATLDGSLLAAAPFGDGIIMVGDNGLVEKLWLAGGALPGVVVTAKGTVREVASTGHSVGIQVRATGKEAHAILEKNLTAGNFIIGISILSLDPLLDHATNTGIEVRVEMQHNTSANNDNVNLAIFGGVGATDNSEVRVEASHNAFREGAALGNVRVVGGQNIFAPGCNDNQVRVSLTDNFIADAPIGLKVEGGNLTPSGPASLPLRQSSNNMVKVNLSDNTFDNNDLDIRADGSLSGTGEPGGDYDQAKVVIEDGSTTGLTTESHNCFPEVNWSTNSTPCTSEATIVFAN